MMPADLYRMLHPTLGDYLTMATILVLGLMIGSYLFIAGCADD